jgi:hypothetical protein
MTNPWHAEAAQETRAGFVFLPCPLCRAAVTLPQPLRPQVAMHCPECHAPVIVEGKLG